MQRQLQIYRFTITYMSKYIQTDTNTHAKTATNIQMHINRETNTDTHAYVVHI